MPPARLPGRPQPCRFNEAAGAYPADASKMGSPVHEACTVASMRPRGRTPRMQEWGFKMPRRPPALQ